MEEFRKLGLSEKTIKILEKKGYTHPTAIQAKAIPLLLEGKKDVVGQSQTGTGKTAVFALPIIEKIDERSRTVQAIILTPTRELAIQVAKEIDSLKGDKKINILCVYGGSSINDQRAKLKKGIDIVVGTPGRIMDLQRRNSLKLDNIKYAVLDEADEMLNMGFVDDIKTILENTPEEKKMLLFSATMPRPILKIAKTYMRDYEIFEVEQAQIITETVEQIYYDINAKDRLEGIKRIVDFYIDFYGIIFCNTKATVDTLTQQLTKLNYHAAALHGDITQGQREKILQQFRNKHIKILVATDVAARGIDVNDLTHVINYSLPQSPESYVHRIGRTGRAGKKGISITLVIPSEKRTLKFVEKINKCTILKQKLPSAKEIIKHKEAQIKTIIKNIIAANSGKSKTSKYNLMAEELLQENSPEEVISAVLKYNFKNELDASNYKDLSEYKPAKSSGSDRGRPRRGSGRDRSSRDRSNGRGRDKSDSRSGRGRSNDRSRGRSSDRSERSSRSRSSDKPRSERKRSDRPKSTDSRKSSDGRGRSSEKSRFSKTHKSSDRRDKPSSRSGPRSDKRRSR